MSTPCTTTAQVEAAIGGTARVQGLLRLHDFRTAKHTLLATWPVLQLADGGLVLLGSPWQADSRPADALLAPLMGQAALATGTLLGEPPGSLQNVAVPCLLPVASLAPG